MLHTASWLTLAWLQRALAVAIFWALQTYYATWVAAIWFAPIHGRNAICVASLGY